MNSVREVKLTKKLQACLARWGTVVRGQPTTVRHLVTGKVTQVPPVTFAVYETLMKAVYVSNVAAVPFEFTNCSWEEHLQNTERHYRAIARKDGFVLPTVGGTDERVSRKAAEDYAYCRRLIIEADGYFALLD
jgi:hypothetical protein